MKTVKLQITDNNGHTEKDVTVTAAVEEAINHHFKHGKWVYVGSEAFQFTAVDPKDSKIEQDRNDLTTMLQAVDNPNLVLTGDMTGGVKRKAKVSSSSKSATRRTTKARSCPTGTCAAGSPNFAGRVSSVTPREVATVAARSCFHKLLMNFAGRVSSVTPREVATVAARSSTTEGASLDMDSNGNTVVLFEDNNRITLTKQPLSSVLGSTARGTRPQLAVDVHEVDGTPRVNLIVSDYNGAFTRLREQLAFISTSIQDVLGNDRMLRTLISSK